MKQKIEIEGRQVSIELTSRAVDAARKREAPIIAEVELYFSCLLRKRMVFHETGTGQDVVPGIKLNFRPIMTKACSMQEAGNEPPPTTDFPIENRQAFVPHWVLIDFQDGKWSGEFGYNNAR